MEANAASNLQTGNSSPSIVIRLPSGDVQRQLLAQAWEVLGVSMENGRIAEQLIFVWDQIRVAVVVPLLRIAIFWCLLATVMILIEKIYVGMVSLIVRIFALKPEKRYKWERIEPDLEKGSAAFPMVVVQIPMYNEKEVYKHSIGAACGLDWPSDRIIIQVLDDSTDLVVKDHGLCALVQLLAHTGDPCTAAQGPSHSLYDGLAQTFRDQQLFHGELEKISLTD